MQPLCFVLMPFGEKEDHLGRKINFDRVYYEIIKPAIVQCDIQPLRADEELILGNIHKPMFERLVLCDYAIADLTSLNPNVFYELGLRHAIKPYSTIPVSAFDAPLPFDVHSERTLPYHLDSEGKLSKVEEDTAKLVELLQFAKNNHIVDSPVFQLLDGWEVSHSLSHEKTDVFREKVNYEKSVKDELSNARTVDAAAIDKVYEKIRPIADNSAGMVIDLFLSYRVVEAWQRMIDIYNEMDDPLKKLKMVTEQLAFAYNRQGEKLFDEADNAGSPSEQQALTESAISLKNKSINILEGLIEKHGEDPETNGILGRVYKDLFSRYELSGQQLKADVNLKRAIEVYKAGFESDWRDAYPGVNMVTLAYVKGDMATLDKHLPIVRFAIEQKLKGKRIDYWDNATLAELAVLEKDYDSARMHLIDAVNLMPAEEKWMIKSTLKNLKMISRGLQKRNEDSQSLDTLIGLFQDEVVSDR